MKREQAIQIIKGLAKSQGLYGRILEVIDTFDDAAWADFDKELEPMVDELDLVMYFEG